jgi:hypothetical protein
MELRKRKTFSSKNITLDIKTSSRNIKALKTFMHITVTQKSTSVGAKS